MPLFSGFMNHFDQNNFFQLLKDKLPKHISLAAYVAETLNVSQNSAYRRISGESKLTVDELFMLVSAAKIDISSLIKNEGKRFTFDYHKTDIAALHLRNSLLQIMYAADVGVDTHLYQASNDLSLFQLMQSPEIASFKLFYLLKTNYASKQLLKTKFSFSHVVEHHKLNFNLVGNIVQHYMKIDEVSIISPSAINYMLDQIEYYWMAGYFEFKQDVVTLFEKIEELLHHIDLQAKSNKKFVLGTKPTDESGSYHLFLNKLMNVSNLILLNTKIANHSFVVINGLNYLHTTENDFYKTQLEWILNLQRKSVPISLGSELNQEQFIRHFEDVIYTKKKHLGIQ